MKRCFLIIGILSGLLGISQGHFTHCVCEDGVKNSADASTSSVPKKQNENDKYVVWENVPYVTNGGVRQQLDLYLPQDYETAAKPVPVVVTIHGGGWTAGSKESAAGMARFFADNGYAVANLNYRLRPDFLLPTQIIDVKSAVRWLRANAKKYNLDTKHFAAWGHSAGGHLSAALGTSAQVKELEEGENLEQSGAVQAVVNFCGPTDFFTFLKNKDHLADPGLFGKNADNKEIIKISSPLQTVTPQGAAFLTVHAIDDELVPIQQGKSLHEALQKAGVESHLLELSSGGHGSPQFHSPETRKIILEFLKKHLQ